MNNSCTNWCWLKMFDMQLISHGTIHSLDNREKWQTEWMVSVLLNTVQYTVWTIERSYRVNGKCSRTQTDWLPHSVKLRNRTVCVQKQKKRLTALGQIVMFPTWQVVLCCAVYTCKAMPWFRQLVSLLKCGFNPKPAHVGFVVDKVAIRHDLSMSSSVFHSQKHSAHAPCSFVHLPLMLNSLSS